MNYTWLEDYCQAKQGAIKDFKVEWQATRFLVGGKMFAMLGSDQEGNPIVTLKLDPLRGELLRSEYQDIVPGYYMNKVHWNSLYLEGAVPDAVLESMVDESYVQVLHTLSKKARHEIADS